MAPRRSVVLALFGLLTFASVVPSWSQPAQVDPGTMWVLLNHVKADQRRAFETFAFEHLLPAARKLAASDPTVKKMLSQTRMLVPKEADPNGTYLHLADASCGARCRLFVSRGPTPRSGPPPPWRCGRAQ